MTHPGRMFTILLGVSALFLSLESQSFADALDSARSGFAEANNRFFNEIYNRKEFPSEEEISKLQSKILDPAHQKVEQASKDAIKRTLGRYGVAVVEGESRPIPPAVPRSPVSSQRSDANEQADESEFDQALAGLNRWRKKHMGKEDQASTQVVEQGRLRRSEPVDARPAQEALDGSGIPKYLEFGARKPASQ